MPRWPSNSRAMRQVRAINQVRGDEFLDLARSLRADPEKGAAMTEPITHTVAAPGAVLTYDVREPETPSDHRPLFIFGSPMGASGFEQLVSHFGDRTVITYDPRGMERSTRTPGGELTVETHPEDYHRVIEVVGLGPVDAFGSSGGGMCALH